MSDQEFFAASRINLQACGRAWRFMRPCDPETLWAGLGDGEADEDERLPYWTEIWPAGIALASWLSQVRSQILGRLCIDLGCGIGLTALVGQRAGARVLALDYEARALLYARATARLNKVSSPLWACMDWRAPALAAHCAHRLWGGDIMYEKRFAAPLLDFIKHALAPGGRAWLAEPCRSVYDAFRSELHTRGWSGRCVYEQVVEALYAQAVPVTVRVWEITPGGDAGTE